MSKKNNYQEKISLSTVITFTKSAYQLGCVQAHKKFKNVTGANKYCIKKAEENVENHQLLGLLLTHCSGKEIVDGIEKAIQQEKFFCAKVIDYLLERSRLPEEEDCSPIPLSPREIEIVQLTSQGLIAKEVADQLNLSLHTIYTHRKNIMRKLGINSVSEMILFAVRNGLVENAERNN